MKTSITSRCAFFLRSLSASSPRVAATSMQRAMMWCEVVTVSSPVKEYSSDSSLPAGMGSGGYGSETSSIARASRNMSTMV